MGLHRYNFALALGAGLFLAFASASWATPPLFHDDFQSGIDPARWTLFNPGGGTWVPMNEGSNGYVCSPAQTVLLGQRQDNMVTNRMDFTDFDMRWNWRFDSEWDHASRHEVYFRSDDSPDPNGYWVHLLTNDWANPHSSSVCITGILNNQWIGLADYVDFPWQLNHWYSFRLRVEGNTFSLKFWSLGDPEPAAWNLVSQDPNNTFTQGRVGLGCYWLGITDADNVVVSPIVATPPPYPVRNPLVPVNGSELQNYLNGLGEGINVFTDQLAAQTYIPSVSGNSAMTLMIELAGNADLNILGVYDANQPNPALYPVFPGGAGAHWSAMVSFLASGDLVVNLFDAAGVPQGHTVFPGANIQRVGFYLDGPGGLFYSEDGRNGGDPQALMFAGTGRNAGDFWVCWEDLHYNQGSDQDFNDEVLLVQSLVPVPAANATWGQIKAKYSR